MHGDGAAPGLAGRRPAARAGAPLGFRLPLVARSALRRWRTLVGMVVGVGAALGVLLLLVALSAGSFRMMVEDYQISDVDLYVVQHGGVLLPILPGDDPGTLRGASQLIAQTRALPGVRGVLGVATRQVERTREGPRRDQPADVVTAVGVDGAPERIPGALLLRSGRWLRRADEVVVGSKLARDRGLALGDTLTLERRRLTVVGIGRLRSVGLGGFGSGAFAFLDRRTLRDLAGLGDEVDLLMVDAADPSATAARLAADLDGVDVVDRAGVIAAVTTLAEHDVVFMRIAGGMALAIAAVFVASMLSRSVAERRAEFATLRAIGVPARTVVGLVVLDAAVVILLAMPIGLAVSGLLGDGINRLYAEWLDVDELYRLDGTLLASVFGLAAASGLVAGLVPARSAVRAEPAEVLRDA